LTNIDYQGRGIPTFKKGNQNEASGVFEGFPRMFSSCIGPIDSAYQHLGERLFMNI